ncbi:MAG: small multi-drug export protein [Eubacterium sp.]|nr:small multi-drug export protein [Eubacterium sp.]
MNPIVIWYEAHLAHILAPQAFVTLISMLPLIELRGGIPVARVLELPLWQALLFSIIGNLIPIPFILLFIKKIFNWLRPTKHLGGIVRKLEARAMKKSDGVSKAEFWGLVAFVGIPLPGTGGWTGALIAALLNIDIKKATLAILLGVAIAATIMSLIAYGVFHM